jgi:hypothetical protein
VSGRFFQTLADQNIMAASSVQMPRDEQQRSASSTIDANHRSCLPSLSRLLAIGLLVLVAATWKLWTPQTVFPQVPLIRAACNWPAWLDWCCLSVLVGCSLVLLIMSRPAVVGRWASAGVAISWAGFFLLDQNRLQPWAWQFFLLAILICLADDATARRGWAWLVISIYFWSAVSKLDYAFFHEQGPALLGGLKRAIGLHGIPNRWTATLDIAGAVGIALGELSVAALLAWPRTRRLGLWAATVMHGALLLALGPLGLNHSAGVLIWNVFFIAQDWLLFSPDRSSPASRMEPGSSRSWRAKVAIATIMVAVLWPALEPIGLCDHWLAWAVYSARPGRTEIIEGEGFDARKVNVTEWSLSELAVPANPQLRFRVGVALSLRSRFSDPGSMSVSTPPNRWDGRVDRTIYPILPMHDGAGFPGNDGADNGVRDLEQIADSFLWNAYPREKRD